MNEPGNGSVPADSGGSVVEAAISQRARAATKSLRESGPGAVPAPPRAGPDAGLLASLRHHLLAGETHYPDRPGMEELRRRVGAALPRAGFPAREPDCVLITQGEGESLFVTLLGLGGGEGATVLGNPGGRHRRLLDWMRVRVAEPGTGTASGGEAAVRLIERDEGAEAADCGDASPDPRILRVHAIGDRLFSGRGGRPSSAAESGGGLADAVVIGSLDGLEGMRPFSLGFVAAPAAVRPRIAKWKQASSICSPAPSQRAALWALGVRP